MDIAIFTCRFGMGHMAQAKVLQRQLKSRYVVEIIDAVDELIPCGSDEIYQFYGKVVAKSGFVYGLYQRLSLTESKGIDRLKILEHWAGQRIRAYEQVPVWIATHSAVAYYLARYRRQHGLDNVLITCITDVMPHELWVNKGTDLYLVPAQVTKESLLTKGVEEQRILVYGLGDMNSLKCDKQAQGFHLLITGGGLGLLPKAPTFYRTIQEMTGGEVRIICGKNKRLYKKLKRAAVPHTTVYGFVDNMEEHLAWAHVYMGKPGGLSTFEAIRTETPILYLKSFLSQECRNSEFILNEGIGWALEEIDPQELFANPWHWEHCRANMRDLKNSFTPERLWEFLEVSA